MFFKINSSVDGSGFACYFHSENRKAIILIETCFRLQFQAGRRLGMCCHWDISKSSVGAFSEKSLLSVNRFEKCLSAFFALSLWFEYNISLSQLKFLSFALKEINLERAIYNACITFGSIRCK